MKLVGLQPSSALTVDPGTPLYECFDRMANRNIGSILVVSGEHHDEVEGILTERDLLRRFREFAAPDSEFAPVWRFMTPKIISLPLARMHEAGALMLAKGIRHVVITHDENEGKPRLAGVVSMRDLFQKFQQILAPKLEPFTELGKRILLVSDSPTSQKLFRTLLARFEGSNFRIASAHDNDWVEGLDQAQALFFDLDHIPVATWTKLFKRVLARPDHPRPIVILFNPLLTDEKTHATLCKASEAGVFRILEKPVSVTDIIGILGGA